MNMDRIEKMCRLCLKSIQTSSSSTYMDNDTFRSILGTVSNFVFTNNDLLPSKVCSECSGRVRQFYDFMEIVRRNQEQLQLMLPPIQVKAEPLKNEIFLESAYEEFGSPVKQEQPPEDEACEIIDVAVELLVDQTGQKTDDEEEPASKAVDEGKRVQLVEEDRLIKEYFALNCDTCSESFETLKQLKHHSKNIHGREAVVQCCNKSFSVRNKILHHINTHLKPFKCDMCDKGFPKKPALDAHYMARHVSSEEKQFKCEKCGQGFYKKYLLQTHLRSHEQVDCSICKKTLSNVHVLKVHMASIHCEEKNFICDICGRGFKSRGSLDTHSVVHSGLKREDGVRCDICNTWISRKKYLMRHIAVIHHGKEVTCNVCHKVYPNDKSLHTHKMRVHVEEKFECGVCGKRFKQPVNMREHMASAHTGQKLYSCEFCGMQMNSKANFYSHKKNKHPTEWLLAKQRAAMMID